MPHINARGMNILKQFEGFSAVAYVDPVGVLTIGYGHTGPDVVKGEVITADQGERLLIEDLAHYEYGVNNLISRPLNSNEFSALVCFAYNVGLGSLRSSTLLKKVNAGDMEGAAQEFGRWVHGEGSTVLEGLVRRRAAEAALFREPG